LDLSADWTTVLTPSIRRTVSHEIKTVELRRIKKKWARLSGPIAALAWDTERTVVAYVPRMRMQKPWNGGAFLRRAIQECAGFHKKRNDPVSVGGWSRLRSIRRGAQIEVREKIRTLAS